jgi:UDP-N-acetylmuramate dehydrogenase
MKIQENVPLAPLTTFRIGGAARFFVQAQNVTDVEEAAVSASEKNLQVFVLGGGSNILVSDTGWDGLVIKMEMRGIAEEPEGESFRFVVGAGENWDDFVKYTVEDRGLYGLENLSAIPGTVGASPVQNIGAYGVEARSTIEWVEVYDLATKKIEKLSNADCRFGYRDSVFKHERKSNIILRVAFLLKEKGRLALEYKDLKRYFTGHLSTPSLRQAREAVVKIRAGKFPDLSKMGTAGSFFRNIVMPRADFQKLVKKYPFAPAFSVDAYRGGSADPMIKVPTAWVLDKVCGFKGMRRGEVGLFENQALVLVNFGRATAEDVKNLANEIIASVKEKTGIVISPEVEFVG